MRKLVAILTCFYPIVIYLLRDSPYFFAVGLSLGGILILEMILRLQGRWRWLSLGGLALLSGLLLSLQADNTVRMYPFVMSFSMLMLFSLTRDPLQNPMIGPFRDKVTQQPAILRAMHEAKWIWIVGLSLNTLILGIMLFAFSQKVWVLYASFYSYLFLLGLLVLSIGFVHVRSRRYE